MCFSAQLSLRNTAAYLIGPELILMYVVVLNVSQYLEILKLKQMVSLVIILYYNNVVLKKTLTAKKL